MTDNSISHVESILNDYKMADAIDILREIPEDELFYILGKIAEGDDFELRHKAIHAAARVNGEHGINFVLPYLHDSNEDIRWLVAGLLADSKDTRAIEPLIQCLATDSCAEVRLIAASALGRIGNLKTIPHLEKALGDKGEDYEGRQISTAAKNSIQEIRLRFRPHNS